MKYIVRAFLPKMRKFIPVKVEAINEEKAIKLVHKKGYTRILYVKEIGKKDN